jgi:predicted nucleic acid-binding protein
VSWVALDLAVADRAAALRGQYRLRTPDAIQLATALEAGADAFLTNDQQLSRVTEVPVLLIDEIAGR